MMNVGDSERSEVADILDGEWCEMVETAPFVRECTECGAMVPLGWWTPPYGNGAHMVNFRPPAYCPVCGRKVRSNWPEE